MKKTKDEVLESLQQLTDLELESLQQYLKNPSVPACHEEDEKLRVESMKSQSRDHPTLATRRLQKTKDEVLESLQQLTDLAAKEQLTREDLEKNEVTDHLYPYIPFNDEGDI